MPIYNSEKTFWSKVSVSSDKESCWEWQGKRNKKGYGYISYQGKQWRTHRLAWFFTFGLINKGLLVRHFVCNNPPCCNPAHLKVGTDADNMNDRDKQNRQAKGSNHGLSKLTETKVKKVKLLLKQGIRGNKIAKQFNVNVGTISAIKLNKTWRHI